MLLLRPLAAVPVLLHLGFAFAEDDNSIIQEAKIKATATATHAATRSPEVTVEPTATTVAHTTPHTTPLATTNNTPHTTAATETATTKVQTGTSFATVGTDSIVGTHSSVSSRSVTSLSVTGGQTVTPAVTPNSSPAVTPNAPPTTSSFSAITLTPTYTYVPQPVTVTSYIVLTQNSKTVTTTSRWVYTRTVTSRLSGQARTSVNAGSRHLITYNPELGWKKAAVLGAVFAFTVGLHCM